MIATSVSGCCICRLVSTTIKENEWVQSIRNAFTSFYNKTCCHLVHTLSHHLQVTFHHQITMLIDGRLVTPYNSIWKPWKIETTQPPSSTLQTTRSFNAFMINPTLTAKEVIRGTGIPSSPFLMCPAFGDKDRIENISTMISHF